MITAERVRALFIYDGRKGSFRRRLTRSPRARAGMVVGTRTRQGYLSVHVDGKNYLIHRLVWLYIYGEWPEKFIDHVNGRKADNRLRNLRLATREENNRNCGIRSHNKTGYKGVTWLAKPKKWMAQIRVDRKQIFLGNFDCPKKAHSAYAAASVKYHGEYSRTK